MCVCVCGYLLFCVVCVRACVRSCVRACVRACVCVAAAVLVFVGGHCLLVLSVCLFVCLHVYSSVLVFASCCFCFYTRLDITVMFDWA